MPSSVASKGKLVSFATLKTLGVIHGANYPSSEEFVFVAHCSTDYFQEEYENDPEVISVDMDLPALPNLVRKKELIRVACAHNVQYKRLKIPELRKLFQEHVCISECDNMVSVFRRSSSFDGTRRLSGSNSPRAFPPERISPQLQHDILEDIGRAFQPAQFEEAGCMVCARLTLKVDLISAEPKNMNFNLLVRPIVTRKPKEASSDDVPRFDGPILASDCPGVCPTCVCALRKKKVPRNALCNGLWLGDVPPELQNLTYAEQMMISKIRHNRCVVRVDSGRGKLVGNAIMYATPVLKVYDKLPPRKDELSEILAFVFLGSQPPTTELLKRTPMIVRKNRVVSALEWLKVNHPSYKELEISRENLDTYELEDVPVTVDWKKTEEGEDTSNPLTISVHGQEQEGEGTTEGPCTFRVDGLTGREYDGMSEAQLKLKALNHMHQGGKALGIGHAAEPESIYDNPMAYPAMFPWLFPYGLGGLGNQYLPERFSETEHKRHLMMYYDKRFQTDLYFPLLAFNHDQIKGSATGSFLLTKKTTFESIANRLLTVNQDVLADVTKRVMAGEKLNAYNAKTDEEKQCFRILEDLDHVGGHVKGSITSKRYMKNEIWALTSHLGAPSWYITLSPADNKHPLCLYYADEKLEFDPTLRSSNERNHLIAQNPVAAARFFDYMIKTFIRCVLGVGTDRDGAYGKTAGYYGTVEQQGRLTLHWHALIWIEGAPSPEVIREMIKGPAGKQFSDSLIAYLESCHEGGLTTGSLSDVKMKVPKKSSTRVNLHDIETYEDANYDDSSELSGYKDPTQTLPDMPPPRCEHDGPVECDLCETYAAWMKAFVQTVDDIRVRSNVHSHHDQPTTKGKKQDNPSAKKIARKGCLNAQGVCSARFPREIVKESVVDFEDGYIKMKHLEEMINCTNAITTWMSKSNTDVSSLLSGTALQAVIAYITNYITKPSLKAHQAMEIMNNLLQSRLAQVLGDNSETRQNNARKLIVQIVNALTAKLEIGSPMASMYVLGNPDHYTSHRFTTLYWRPFVHTVQADWGEPGEDDAGGERVIVTKDGDDYVSYSRSDDYRYRPRVFDDVPMVEWFRCSRKSRHDKDSLAHLSGDQEEVKLGWWRLHPSHPQYNTHIVQYNPRFHQNNVLNYVGGLLPRKDVGDREYYCMTMLCLFKPWRTGRDLKSAEKTWDDAFHAHQFEDWMVARMKNFNLRYECYDARHDFYHIQLQKTKALSKLQAGVSGEDSDSDDEGDYVAPPPEDYVEDGDDTGAREDKRTIQMKDAERVMRNAGWLEHCDLAPPKEGVFKPLTTKTPAQWREAVASERKKVLAARHADAHSTQDINDTSPPKKSSTKVNVVRVVDPMKLMPKTYQENADVRGTQKQGLVTRLELNEEQERAFRIVANHASVPQEKPLRMYLGGMGGTGKSQVIKALVGFFKGRKELYRLVLLAPTGTAAALIGGSTYHSAFAIRGGEWKGGGSEIDNIRRLQTNLDGVEYIFIDEVSMIAARSIYQISAKLAKARGCPDEPFGGVNIIFAGDFVQLPPVKLNPVWKKTNYKNASKPNTLEQEEDIGRAVWRQVTTVVILKKNMRQTEDGDDDQKFRKALINMRYRNCDEEDIQWLQSRVVGVSDDRPKLYDPIFRNVAVITPWNSAKDRLNDLGGKRYASDTRQELVDFYSRDELAPTPSSFKAKKKKKIITTLGERTQKALWDASPCTSDHFAGKLSLCPGMPVILRHNDATELCITKGQEGKVYGWEHSVENGRNYLDVLYVKLTEPPRTVNIPGLPTNVVPIMRSKRVITCDLPNDKIIHIKRDQVEVLSFFALTVHSAQGKSRDPNVVDLHNCPDHLFYYTSLSRGTSAAGICIIQGFDPDKITRAGGQMSGFLRQELRDLDILDEITKLRFEGKLDEQQVRGDHRYTLILSYKDWKAAQGIHAPDTDPLWDKYEVRPWQLHDVDKKKYKDMAVARETKKKAELEKTSAKRLRQKRKREPAGNLKFINVESQRSDGADVQVAHEGPKRKKVTHDRAQDNFVNSDWRDQMVKGLRWDPVNWSCAYDSVFTLMWNIWLESPEAWSRAWSQGNELLSMLVHGFRATASGSYTLALTRGYLREKLHLLSPTAFPAGANSASVHGLQERLFTDFIQGSTSLYCDFCRVSVLLEGQRELLNGWAILDEESVASCLDNLVSTRTNEMCYTCGTPGVRRIRHIGHMPDLMTFAVGFPGVFISHNVQIHTVSGLKTFRYIDGKRNMWFHDGRTTGEGLRWDGTLSPDTDVGMRMANMGVATQAFYVIV